MRVVEQAAPPSKRKSLLNLLFGRPLSSEEGSKEQLGPLAGVPVFGLDALSSTAYGPEAALTILLAIGSAGSQYIFGLNVTIIVLLSIVYFSYRQTIAAYPNGGGSYTVASENLGARIGLLAGASLMLDYILNVAVGISAGVGAVVSAAPSLQRHTLGMCLGILLVLTLINLRGIREAGLVFMAPTYIFIACLGGVIALGLYRAMAGGGHPSPMAALPRPSTAAGAVTAWLLLKAFASGCTALTGIEAVSNGVQTFRDDRVKNARITLTFIIVTLIAMLAGVSYLCKVYAIAATVPGRPGYQTVLSQVTMAVAGRGVFYYVTTAAVLTVLVLSANTSFADFPRVCRAIAEQSYLPYGFAVQGRRLVFTVGICTLAIWAAVLLIAFGGVTDRLIPLFAVGAFTAFTLSQAGMVVHWRRKREGNWRSSMAVNGLGAVATGLTTCMVIVAKFTEGAWVTVIAIPAVILLMLAVHRHYERLHREIEIRRPVNLQDLDRPIVVLPLQHWSKVGEKALRFAYKLSDEIIVLHVAPQNEEGEKYAALLQNSWSEFAEKPAREAGFPPPKLVVMRSPYRLVLGPIFQYVQKVERENPKQTISVLLPEVVEKHWLYYLLHNQRVATLKLLLYLRGDGRIVVVSVPWYVRQS